MLFTPSLLLWSGLVAGAYAQTKKLLVGAPNQVLAVDFDGRAFNVVANVTEAGTGPSWMLFKQPNILYVVNENSDNTQLFNFDPATNALVKVQDATGSRGVVFLEFNLDQTRMVGAAFGAGTLDVWDTSSPTGKLVLIKTIVSNDALGPNAQRQEAPHPHQVLVDPTGRFFVANDLGTDTILVIDSLADRFEVTNRVRTDPAGCGPRHGAFFPAGIVNAPATHYILVCELLNLVEVFELTYVADTIQFELVQTLSTFGADFPPANAATPTAGEIVLSANSADVYVSNRLTGNATDSIAHFRVNNVGGAAGISLSFVSTTSSLGSVPRMFSLSGPANANFPIAVRLNVVANAAAQDIVFVGNQRGAQGLVALARDRDTGIIGGVVDAAGGVGPLASVANAVFGGDNAGPQFVMEVPVPGVLGAKKRKARSFAERRRR